VGRAGFITPWVGLAIVKGVLEAATRRWSVGVDAAGDMLADFP